MSEVICRVEECYYNQDQTCIAPSIEVVSSVTNNVVYNNEDTACETFTPREEEE